MVMIQFHSWATWKGKLKHTCTCFVTWQDGTVVQVREELGCVVIVLWQCYCCDSVNEILHIECWLQLEGKCLLVWNMAHGLGDAPVSPTQIFRCQTIWSCPPNKNECDRMKSIDQYQTFDDGSVALRPWFCSTREQFSTKLNLFIKSRCWIYFIWSLFDITTKCLIVKNFVWRPSVG